MDLPATAALLVIEPLLSERFRFAQDAGPAMVNTGGRDRFGYHVIEGRAL